MNVYQIVTDRIITALEAGQIPWRKPWKSLEDQNFATGKPYHGVNRLLTGLSDFTSPYWLTYKQAQAKGGQVRKGEKGTPITFWNIQEDEETGKKIPFLRFYTAFNADQVDGIDFPALELANHDPIPACEAVVNRWESKPPIEYKGGRACYVPSVDRVQMPEPGAFEAPEFFYSTLFHELIHSTGHPSRLNRDLSGSFGTKAYAKEELIAEVGAAFLANKTGIFKPELFDNSAAYLQSWLKVLREDPRLIVTAAGQAEKAVNLISEKAA